MCVLLLMKAGRDTVQAGPEEGNYHAGNMDYVADPHPKGCFGYFSFYSSGSHTQVGTVIPTKHRKSWRLRYLGSWPQSHGPKED